MGAKSSGITVNTQRKSITIPLQIRSKGGIGTLTTIYRDEQALVIAVGPPSPEGSSYRVSSKGRTEIALPVSLPDGGKYEYVGQSRGLAVCVHESRLPSSPDAKLMRSLKLYPDLGALKKPRVALSVVASATGRRRSCPEHNQPLTPTRHNSKWVGYRCLINGAVFYPQEGTLLTRGRRGFFSRLEAMWLYANGQARSYHDLEQIGISHSEAVRINLALTPLIPKLPKLNLAPFKPPAYSHLHLFPSRVGITKRAWSRMGRPKRVDMIADPVRGIVTIRPNPNGSHSLSPHAKEFPEGGQTFTIANLEYSMPLGRYLPMSLGRFEGVFKLENPHRVFIDNPL